MDGISSRDRRTLLLGAAAVALMLGVGRGLPAWRAWDAEVRASAALRSADAARAERSVATLPALLDSLQARRARFAALEDAALDGRSPTVAGAALASLVSSAAASAGVQVGSVQIRPDTASGVTLRRVHVRADGTGDLAAITRMIVLLEGAPELLAIRELAITQPNAGGPADQPEALRLEIGVEALALPSRGGASGSAPPDSASADSTAGAPAEADGALPADGPAGESIGPVPPEAP